MHISSCPTAAAIHDDHIKDNNSAAEHHNLRLCDRYARTSCQKFFQRKLRLTAKSLVALFGRVFEACTDRVVDAQWFDLSTVSLLVYHNGGVDGGSKVLPVIHFLVDDVVKHFFVSPVLAGKALPDAAISLGPAQA